MEVPTDATVPQLDIQHIEEPSSASAQSGDVNNSSSSSYPFHAPSLRSPSTSAAAGVSSPQERPRSLSTPSGSHVHATDLAAAAQRRSLRVDAISDAWTAQSMAGVGDYAELLATLAARERALQETQEAARLSEERAKKEIESLTAALAREESARSQTEEQMEELLAAIARHDEEGIRQQLGQHPSFSFPASRSSSPRAAATPSPSSVGDTFWLTLKAREERARARARRSFVQASQHELHVAQEGRQIAERQAAEAARCTEAAERSRRAALDDAHRAQQQLEQVKSQLHECTIQIEDALREAAALRQRLAALEAAAATHAAVDSKTCEDLRRLAAQRAAEVEAQRAFVRLLLEELGLPGADDALQGLTIAAAQHLVAQMQERLRDRERTWRSEEEAARAELQAAVATLRTLRERYAAARETAEGCQRALAAEREQHGQQMRQLAEAQEAGLARLRAAEVEKRSLSLQLARVSEVAEALAQERVALREAGRLEREALLRQHDATVAGLQEEVDRLQMQQRRDREAQLQRTIELSEDFVQWRASSLLTGRSMLGTGAPAASSPPPRRSSPAPIDINS